MYNFLLTAVVLLSLLLCFFGYRMFRFVLAIAGFLIGALFVAGFGFTLTDGKEIVVILIAAVAGGLIIGALFLFLYSAGVFLVGAIFGILLFSGIIGFVNGNTSLILYILPALVGGILALLLQKFIIILITSFTGAWVSVMAVLYFINRDFSPFRLEFLDLIGENQTYRIVFSWLALGMLGFITQYIIFPKKGKNTEAVALSDEQGV